MTKISSRLQTRLVDLDFGEAQAAIESLGTTIADLSKRATYEIEDAMDKFIDTETAMTSSDWFRLVGYIKEVIAAHEGRVIESDRFESYEEMSQWVGAAAEERGLATEEDESMGKKTFHVTTPLGKLSFTVRHDPGHPPSVSCATSTDGPAQVLRAARFGRELLRAAQALQADA